MLVSLAKDLRTIGVHKRDRRKIASMSSAVADEVIK
jgi:hypothetical protein